MNYNFFQQPFPVLAIDNEYVLREQSLNDTSAFFDYYADPAVSRYILASTPQNLTDAMNEIHYCRSLFYQKSGIYWAICQKTDNRMIGAVGIYINSQHNRGEICYDLHKDYWRRGIMSRAIKKVMDFAFEHIKLDRLEAVTVKENVPSMTILDKIGYIREGTLHNYRHHDDKPHDVELFGITPALYRAHQRQLEQQKEKQEA